MRAPSPSGGEGPDTGAIDALMDELEKMRKEFRDQLADLSKRIEQVNDESKERDGEQVIVANDFEERIKKLEGQTQDLQENKADKIDLNDQVNRLEAMIEAMAAGKPVEVRAATPTGPKISDADIDKWNKAAELVLKHQIIIDKLCKDVDEVDKLKVRVQQLEKKAADFLTRDEFNPFA